MNSHNDKAEQFSLEIDNFDLDAYFSYIGLADAKPAQLSLETLNIIVKQHLSTFNYQNTAIYKANKISADKKKIPSLDINSLFPRMVKKHGGYCFQHLELVCAVLTKMGFTVDRHLAKVILQPSSPKGEYENADVPKSHELVVVHMDNTQYIIDVGMANRSLRKPLVLKEGEQIIDDDQYRLTYADGKWILDTKTVRENTWFCMYHFFNEKVQQDDVHQAHREMYLSDKKIPIREKILIATTTEKSRKFAFWSDTGSAGTFKSIKKNSEREPKIQKFNSYEEFHSFAKQKFGIK